MKLLSRIFSVFKSGTDSAVLDSTEANLNQETTQIQSQSSEIDVTAFVDATIRSLVDNPEEVNIESNKSGQSLVIKVSCQKSDIRRVIGKNGKTINSIRMLARGAAKRSRQNVEIIVLD